MEILNKWDQTLAVQKVLEEMEKAEEILNSWNTNWTERCLDAYSDNDIYNVKEIEKKYNGYYDLNNLSGVWKDYGMPLRKVLLTDNHNNKYECKFAKIEWNNVLTNKSKRSFSFINNGDIHFNKDNLKETLKGTSYDAVYNVLSNDFSLNITTNDLYKDNYGLSLKENKLLKRINGNEIIQDLDLGTTELISVSRKNKTSVIYETKLDSNNSLEYSAVSINTYGVNGKVNGTFRFAISKKKGARANYYDTEGFKINLITNPYKVEFLNEFLLNLKNSKNRIDVISYEFIIAVQDIISNGITKKYINYDDFNISEEYINTLDLKIIGKVKCVKEELPLPGLTDRINKCLGTIKFKEKVKEKSM